MFGVPKTTGDEKGAESRQGLPGRDWIKPRAAAGC